MDKDHPSVSIDLSRAGLAVHTGALVSAISMVLSIGGCGAEPVAKSAPTTSPADTAASSTAAAPTPNPAVAASVATPTGSTTPTGNAAGTSTKPKPLPPGAVEGRPFVVAGAARLAETRAGTGWCREQAALAPEPSPAERAALIEHFMQWSRAEHASIASFARFALQLVSFGAPAHLVDRAAEAMRDEVRHAQIGFSVIAELSGQQSTPAPLRVDGALDGSQSLEQALRMNVREGMINETLAALELCSAAGMCSSPQWRATLRSVADDETRHAELAYMFASWALKQRPQLARVLEEEVAAWEVPDQLPGAAGLEAWGVLDGASRRALQRDGFVHAVRPLILQLVEVARAASAGSSTAAGARV